MFYYRQPKYYGEFKCIGSECLANCCFGWNIDWSKNEIDKVKNDPNCSAELKEIMENGFVPRTDGDENAFVVKLNEHGKCPCQTETGLCMIQKELGAEYLSKTCTVYPRYNALHQTDNLFYRGCNLSCPEIVRMLVNDEKATDLVNVPSKQNHITLSLKYSFSKENISANPELKYAEQIIEFFYELIGDKKFSIETTCTLGALAAHNLTQLISARQFDAIPDALKTYRKEMHYATGLRAIDNIKPNYNVCFGVADKIIDDALDYRIIDVLRDENGEPNVNRYLAGVARLNEMMKDKPFWLQNIAQSLILELGIPFKSLNNTVYENYSFFVAAVSCLKLNAIAAAFVPEETIIKTKGQELNLNGLDKIYGLTGILSRQIFQSNKSFDNVNKVLGEFKWDSPVYLALLIK